MVSLSKSLESWRVAFESYYQETMQRLYPSEEVLHQACRYALLGPGKRIRPLLTLASCHAAGADYKMALDAAVAVEWVHTYSLVHDDLPCMDNDDWRRGRPTTHKRFDESVALLVGDALLTDAFLIIDSSAQVQPGMVSVLAKAAGGQGMVRGQALDIHWTGRHSFERQDLDAIHRRKTGDLIAASCVLGGLSAQASDAQQEALSNFGSSLGLAFQIVDDLLDSSQHTGKSSGKDQSSGKLTYLSLMSEEQARHEAERLTTRTLQTVAPWGNRAEPLLDLARSLLTRNF